MKLLINIARIIIALVFIYSGFTKGIDPYGSAIKFSDYFNVFGLSCLNTLALYIAVFLSSIEFVIGISLFIKLKTKYICSITFWILSFFTILTLVLAIKNPVSDCGCFGDAIILSNWETFFKNVILLALSTILFLNRKKINSYWLIIDQYFWIIFSFIFIVSISVYSINHLPILDFRPYSIGTNIPENMIIPEGAAIDEYKSIFKYRNIQTGEIKEFDESNYPWNDSLNWEYLEIKQELIKKGYKPNINDFNIEHTYKGNITESILTDNGYTFLLISHNLNKANTGNIKHINKLHTYCNQENHKFYCLTASIKKDIDIFSENNNANYEYCNMDETLLKTVIRSNPGLVLLRNGTIIGKWHYNDIPEIESINNKELSSYCIQERTKTIDRYFILIIILIWISALLFYVMRKYKKRLR